MPERFMVSDINGWRREGQPVGFVFFLLPPGRLARTGLPICELQCLGSLFCTCLNCGLWRNLNSSRPFHSFESLGQPWLTHFPGVIRVDMILPYPLCRSNEGTNLLKIIERAVMQIRHVHQAPMHQAGAPFSTTHQSHNSLHLKRDAE